MFYTKICAILNVQIGLLPQMEFVMVILLNKLECHDSCLNCSYFGQNNCESCYPEKFFYKNTCVTECPEKTYPNFDEGKCFPCKYPCEKCVLKSQCASCLEPYYFYPKNNTCLSKNPSGTYINTTSKTFMDCHNSCLECLGPSSYECTLCDITKGYLKLETSYGSCYFLECTERQYFNESRCFSCDFSCRSCTESGFCTNCKKGYIPYIEDDKIKCKGCPNGYTLNSKLKCIGKVLFIS